MFTLLADLWTGLGGGQHGIVSTVLQSFTILSDLTFHVLSVRHMMHMRYLVKVVRARSD